MPISQVGADFKQLKRAYFLRMQAAQRRLERAYVRVDEAQTAVFAAGAELTTAEKDYENLQPPSPDSAT